MEAAVVVGERPLVAGRRLPRVRGAPWRDTARHSADGGMGAPPRRDAGTTVTAGALTQRPDEGPAMAAPGPEWADAFIRGC
jgi:hypothetical protein